MLYKYVENFVVFFGLGRGYIEVVLKLEIWSNNFFPELLILTFSFFKEEHPEKILLILLTLFVLNEDKSIDFREEHSENIHFISLTLAVLNEDKSIDSKEEHLQNILPISLTLVVLNEDKSIDFKEEHP